MLIGIARVKEVSAYLNQGLTTGGEQKHQLLSRRKVMSYIDGFVIPVPADKKETYRALAVQASAVFKEFGATRVVECWGDDLPDGKGTGFKLAVKAEADENVVFSWIVWPSKAVRDEGNAKVMKDPRMQPGEGMPFDGKRMFFGGFEMLLDTN